MAENNVLMRYGFHREKHPELFTAEGKLKMEDSSSSKPESAPKTLTPIMIYVTLKTEEHIKKDPSVRTVN